MIVKNANGREFFVRTVMKGDRYGLDDCLTHGKDEPMVEFYDWKYANQKTFGPRGQFVSRYGLSTLRERPHGGLCLDFGIPEWSVDAGAMASVWDLVKKLDAAIKGNVVDQVHAL
jgi:hypothetical protein